MEVSIPNVQVITLSYCIVEGLCWGAPGLLVRVNVLCMQAETADDVTTFRGAVVPAQKECLLMIDLHSGVGMVCVYVCVVHVVSKACTPSCGYCLCRRPFWRGSPTRLT